MLHQILTLVETEFVNHVWRKGCWALWFHRNCWY